jgi:hypothetical protein
MQAITTNPIAKESFCSVGETLEESEDLVEEGFGDVDEVEDAAVPGVEDAAEDGLEEGKGAVPLNCASVSKGGTHRAWVSFFIFAVLLDTASRLGGQQVTP